MRTFYVWSDFDPLTFGQVRAGLDPRSSPPPSSHQVPGSAPEGGGSAAPRRNAAVDELPAVPDGAVCAPMIAGTRRPHRRLLPVVQRVGCGPWASLSDYLHLPKLVEEPVRFVPVVPLCLASQKRAMTGA